VIVRSGHVVQSIVDAAIEFDADLIGMPTAGHHGVLDALRGSTRIRLAHRHVRCRQPHSKMGGRLETRFQGR
jgi:nucleotide-binding universal stress UspA family protein